MASMERVWNISDHPETNVPEQILVVLGVKVPPGASVKVPVERLKNAHKVNKAVADGLLFVGATPPASYLKAKEPGALAMPRGHQRARFDPVTSAAKEPPKAKEKVTVALEDAVAVSDTVDFALGTESRKNGGRRR